jgi:hypothetical protein
MRVVGQQQPTAMRETARPLEEGRWTPPPPLTPTCRSISLPSPDRRDLSLLGRDAPTNLALPILHLPRGPRPLRRLERHILQQLRDPGRIFCRASKKSWPEHELVQRSHGDGVRPAARSAALEVGGNAATGRADGAAPAVEALHHPGAWRLARWQIKMAFSVVCDSTNMGEDVGIIGECEELGMKRFAHERGTVC